MSIGGFPILSHPRKFNWELSM